ncbi:MAG: hypothetical protein WCH83_14860 [Alphaproteobacteria bacterium]
MTDAPTALRLWQQRLFSTPTQTAITLVILTVAVWAVTPLVRWALINATWSGETRADCSPGGACWVFIRVRFGQFMYGFYPAAERWRPNLFGLLALASIVPLFIMTGKARLWLGLAALLALPPLGIWLIYGGFGLTPVETRQWGGLMLTLFIAVYAGLIAVPLGILLALGRQSRLPLIRTLSVIFIEFWRGVPILTVIGIGFGLSLGGAFVIEQVFSLPGVGRRTPGRAGAKTSPSPAPPSTHPGTLW